MQDVTGKIAFVTGGSSGIGLGIARAFAHAGMKVAIGYRTKSHLGEALEFFRSASDRVHAINVDVTDRSALQKAADEISEVFGKVHVLVCNAGVVHPAPLRDTTYDDWDWLINVNLNGVFNAVRTFLPRIAAHGEGGHVIATASVLGLFAVGAGQGAYTASKFAVVGFIEALRNELAGTNIGASVFCPGVVQSNIIDSSRNRPGGLPDTAFQPDAESIARERVARGDPSFAMDPLEAGQLVLQGMRNDDLYILSHSEYEGIIRDRNEALLAAIPKHVKATDVRLTMVRQFRSIYAAERDRKSRQSASLPE